MFDLDGSGGPTATRARQERVVLVHCSASSARQWKALADQLGRFQSVALDLYGHGNRKRWHGTGPLSLSEEAAAIGGACPDGAPFHLVGHSYGGAVALRFALASGPTILADTHRAELLSHLEDSGRKRRAPPC